MLLLFIACTVGTPGPATPGSVSAVEAETMDEVARAAWQLANKARELEVASVTAIDAEERAERMRELEALMTEIEALNVQLQTGHSELEARIRRSAQSTEDTRE